jgi:ethanolamine permease
MAELSAALPFSGAQATFATASMGSLVGCFTGFCYLFEFILATSQTMGVASSYITLYFGTSRNLEPLWWCLYLICFIVFNSRYTSVFRVALVLTLVALIALFVFVFLTFPIQPTNMIENWNTSDAFPKGFPGVVNGLPYAIWWYLGIELLPVAAEETKNPTVTIPKALIASMSTLTVASLWTFFLATSAKPGVLQLMSSGFPLNDAVGTYIDLKSVEAGLFYLFMLTGIYASFHCLMYGYTRYLYALSRGGYISPYLSVTDSKSHIPMRALIAGTLIVICFNMIVFFSDSSSILVSFLLNASVMYSLFGYFLTFLSFIRLRQTIIPRPWINPLGNASAIFGICICCVAIVGCLITQTIFQVCFVLILCQIMLFTPYYLLFVRKRLLLSPESMFMAKYLSHDKSSLLKVLRDPNLYPMLESMLKEEFCAENGMFFQDYDSMSKRQPATSGAEEDLVKELCRKYLIAGAPYELNIPSGLVNQVMNEINTKQPTLSMLEPINHHIVQMIFTNTYKRYLRRVNEAMTDAGKSKNLKLKGVKTEKHTLNCSGK